MGFHVSLGECIWVVDSNYGPSLGPYYNTAPNV